MSNPRPSRISSLFPRIFRVLLYLLPVSLFFSYYPVISLGSNSSMNFELSIPLIWLVFFDIVAFITLITLARPRHQTFDLPGISDRRFFLLSLFPLYATLSVLWSENPLRGLLTAGIIWLIFFAVFAIISITPMLDKFSNLCYNENNPSLRGELALSKNISPARFSRILLWSLFISTSVICLLCFIQSVLDILGVDRSATLLCSGCTYHSFGFPHPSGFAIEPQFMGNLLLAPTLTALYLLCFDKNSKSSLKTEQGRAHSKSQKTERSAEHISDTFPQQRKTFPKIALAIFASIFSTTLFFTFSRGAIYAYAIALAILLIFALIRHHFHPTLIIIPCATFLAALSLQGIFAAVGPTTETFSSAISSSIHQLSLGIIDFRDVSDNAEVTDVITDDQSSSPSETPVFSGYVAESTNTRLLLNQVAFYAWLSAPGHHQIWVTYNCHNLQHVCTSVSAFAPTSILFGTGLGSAGTVMHAYDPEQVTSPKEIVQNQPISLLLELGLVGVSLCLFGLLIALFPKLFPARFLDGRATPNASTPLSLWQHPALPLLLALIVAYITTLQFFSGLPNALQIYLMPPLLFIILGPQASAKKSSKSPCL